MFLHTSIVNAISRALKSGGYNPEII